MANTFTQLRVHLIFAIKGRQHLIPEQYREEVQKYMTRIIQEHKHKMLAIYCMPDHVHIFIGLHPSQSISDLVSVTKTSTTKFIKRQSWMPFAFAWQDGYGAFSYSKSQTDAVVKYVLNQKEHHRIRTFREEYIDILTQLEIEFDKKYLFEFYE